MPTQPWSSRLFLGRLAVPALRCFIGTLLLSAAVDSFCTTKAQTWASSFGTAGYETARTILPSGRGTIIAGETDSAGAGGLDGLVVGLDGCGQIEWSRTYGGAGDDEFFVAAAAPDGGGLIVGQTGSLGPSLDFWMLRLSSDGNLLWDLALGGSDDEVLRAVTRTAGGDWIVAGERATASGLDAWLAAVDDAGNVLWQRRISASGDELVAGIVEASNTDLLLAGSTDSTGAGFFDFWAVRLDSSGALLWQKTYGGITDENAASVTRLDSDFLISGLTDSFGSGLFDAWLVRIDSSGSVVWQRAVGTSDDDEATASWSSAAGIRAAGFTFETGMNSSDAWLMGLDPAGQIDWQKSYGGAMDEFANAGAFLGPDRLMTVGSTESFGAGGTDLFALQLDEEGAPEPGCGLEQPSNLIAVATSGVTGTGTAAISNETLIAAATGFAGASLALSASGLCAVTPGEVSPPGALQPLVFSSGSLLEWESAALSCASSFNVYRGEIAALRGGSGFGDCFVPGVTGNQAGDVADPDPGKGWFYLVTASAGSSEGSAGFGTSGSPRPLSAPCP